MNEGQAWPIVGHENAVNFLKESIRRGKVAHAYLFAGSSGIGKSIVAESFAKSLFCGNIDPCRECIHCRYFVKGIHPDFYRLELGKDEETGKEKKNIGVGEIRELRERLSEGALLGSYKVAILDGAEMLSEGAANALLKVLEEPRPKTVFILLASDVKSVLPTIASRTQIMRFLPVRRLEIYKYLLGLGSERKEAEDLAALSGGLAGKAIMFKKNPELFDEYKDRVNSFLAILESDLNGGFKEIGRFFGEKKNTLDRAGRNKIFSAWHSLLRDILLIKGGMGGHIENVFVFDRLSRAAVKFDITKSAKLIESLLSARASIDANVRDRLALENFAVSAKMG